MRHFKEITQLCARQSAVGLNCDVFIVSLLYIQELRKAVGQIQQTLVKTVS